MAVTAWVAQHTGLPSFAVTAGETVTTWDGRVLTTGAQVEAVSDALAQPGAPSTYTLGDGEQVVLTRTVAHWWQACLTTVAGRVVPDVAWDADGDPADWDADVSIFNQRVFRWPTVVPARTGSGTFTVLAPAREPALWEVLQAHSPLILATGEPAAAVPMRAILLQKAARKRVSGDGIVEVTASWTEIPWDAPALRSGRAPVVTWGDWEAKGNGWESKSYLDLCRDLAGMPA